MKYKDNYRHLAPEDPVSSERFLKEIIDKFKIDLMSPQHVISVRWKEIVGENLAQCAYLSSIQDNVLHVKCKNGSSAALVRMSSREIIKKINAIFPELDIVKIAVSIMK